MEDDLEMIKVQSLFESDPVLGGAVLERFLALRALNEAATLEQALRVVNSNGGAQHAQAPVVGDDMVQMQFASIFESDPEIGARALEILEMGSETPERAIAMAREERLGVNQPQPIARNPPQAQTATNRHVPTNPVQESWNRKLEAENEERRALKARFERAKRDYMEHVVERAREVYNYRNGIRPNNEKQKVPSRCTHSFEECFEVALQEERMRQEELRKEKEREQRRRIRERENRSRMEELRKDRIQKCNEAIEQRRAEQRRMVDQQFEEFRNGLYSDQVLVEARAIFEEMQARHFQDGGREPNVEFCVSQAIDNEKRRQREKELELEDEQRRKLEREQQEEQARLQERQNETPEQRRARMLAAFENRNNANKE